MTTITFHVRRDPDRPGRLEAVAIGPDGRTIAYGNADAFWFSEEYETAPYASDVVIQEMNRFFLSPHRRWLPRASRIPDHLIVPVPEQPHLF